MKFSDLYEQIVKEMSAPWEDYVNPIPVAHGKWEECKRRSKKVKGFISEQFGEVDVFLCTENGISSFFFFVKDELWGTVETRILRDSGIQVQETIKCVNLGLYMSDIFKDYFLENFAYILSSSYHTTDGFSLYIRLSRDPSVQFTIVDENTKDEIKLDDPEDLKNYYGKDKKNFIYKIEKVDKS